MGADTLEAARDNILGLNCSAATSVEDFGDRFGHVRLRFGATGGPGYRSPLPFCQIRAISQWPCTLWVGALCGRSGSRSDAAVARGLRAAYILLAFQSSLMT
jgi:hypothetical protein